MKKQSIKESQAVPESGGEPKAQPRKRAPQRRRKKKESRAGAWYVLTIMTLLTALVIIVNKSYLTDGKDPLVSRNVPSPKETIKAEKGGKPQEVAKEYAKENTRESIKEIQPTESTEKKKTATIYLLQVNEKREELILRPIKREIPERGSLESAIKSLVKGPSGREKERGFLSAIPANTKVYSVKINKGTAYINLSGHIEDGAAGNILLSRLNQIVYTATSWPGVKQVRLLINGKKRATIGPDGLSIAGPLRRK